MVEAVFKKYTVEYSLQFRNHNPPEHHVFYTNAPVTCEGFVQELLDDRTNRKEALVEWVRRGGQLLVSVGRNQQLAGKLLEAMKVIDCQVTGLTVRQQLTQTATWAQAGRSEKPGTF